MDVMIDCCSCANDAIQLIEANAVNAVDLLFDKENHLRNFVFAFNFSCVNLTR